jgi:hypothetical protein
MSVKCLSVSFRNSGDQGVGVPIYELLPPPPVSCTIEGMSERGGLSHLAWLIGPRGTTTDVHGKSVIVRHSYVEGLTPEEMYACIAGARKGLAQWWARWEQLGQGIRDRGAPRGFNVLARARRSKHPGIVFARAAATGEVDPLVDVDSRLFVGLPVTTHG